MIPKVYDGTIFSVAAVSGVQTGSAFSLYPAGHDRTTHETFNITLVSGTATWVLEGRMSAADAWVQIDTGSATKSDVIGFFPHYRVRLTAATTATVTARLGRTVWLVQ